MDQDEVVKNLRSCLISCKGGIKLDNLRGKKNNWSILNIIINHVSDYAYIVCWFLLISAIEVRSIFVLFFSRLPHGRRRSITIQTVWLFHCGSFCTHNTGCCCNKKEWWDTRGSCTVQELGASLKIYFTTEEHKKKSRQKKGNHIHCTLHLLEDNYYCAKFMINIGKIIIWFVCFAK